MVGGEPEEKSLGEGKCSDTHIGTNPCIHTYCNHACFFHAAGECLCIHTYICGHLNIPSFFYNVINPIRATKGSDLSVKITYTLSALFFCCALSLDSFFRRGG